MSNAAQKIHPVDELREFVVTTFGPAPADRARGAGPPKVLKSEVWDCHHPLAIGHPVRWVLERTPGGVRFRNLGTSANQTVLHPFRDIPLAELFEESPIELDAGERRRDRKTWVTIRPVPALARLAEEASFGLWMPEAIASQVPPEMAGNRAFRVASYLVLAAVIAMAGALWVMPTEKENPAELIPPQFAKVLLSPAVKTSSTGGRKAASGGKPVTYNVVQAFQNEAVQKTTKTLLSASVAKSLFAKSSLLDQVTSKQVVEKVFDQKTNLKTDKNVTLDAMEKAPKQQVGLMGGNGGKGAAGYGNSNGVALEGQGKGLIGVSGEGMGVDEGLTKDQVGAVIRKHLSEVRYCYEAAMVRDPTFEGKLVVSFTIKKMGNVIGAKVKESSGSRSMDGCILGRLTTWQFPKPKGGVDVGVSYPFIFKSLGN